ncbi:unnamed protein product [Linum tenue]|uniref:Uncharacterized protein n=1 Tax=Linum tenue TaxID=586396 RepID=A0AAV0QCN4_9ROSI|nr:unnamed protein product [Linum tenue]
MNIHSTLSSPANFNLLFPCSPFMANYSILSREESTGATAGRAMKPKSPAAPDLLEIHGYRGSLRSSENRGTHSVFVQLVAAVSFLLIINIPAADAAVPAVFIFGDSLVDTGNNNYIVSVAKSDFPPYGRDFPGGTATGRFGNGRILPDFIGEIFGVKNLLPPYKDPTLQMQDLLTGVSFGSAGAGYDPLTSTLTTATNIKDQLEMYREYRSKINGSAGKERADEIISTSPHIIVLGTNDVGIRISTIRRAQYDSNTYTDILVELALDVVKKLYGHGARRIGVVGAAPIGCVPLQRILGGGLLERHCNEELNEAAKLFNSKLSPAISTLNQQLPGAKIVYFDIFTPALSLIQNPAPYGIVEVTRGCCGTGTIELGILCVVPGTCPDATKYLFWDSVHPGEKASRIISDGTFDSASLSTLLG